MVCHVGPAAGAAQCLGRVTPWLSACSITSRPPGRRSSAAARRDGQRDAQPVLAAAEEGELGVVVAHLGVERHHADRDVRRVGHDDVHRPSSSGKASVASPSRRSTASPVSATLRSAHAWRLRPSSTAYTVAVGTSSATASAMAPDPVHRSTTTGASSAWAASIASPATNSVSGRGTKTPGPDGEVEAAEPGAPGEVLQGHP